MTKRPFFERFIQEQRPTAVKTDVKGGAEGGRSARTHKEPSDNDENVTLKYPSDTDEGVPW